MKISKKLILLLFINLILFTSGCKTDFEVNAPGENFTVVYGLLNVSDTMHYVKINKSFIGSADAYEMAQIQDSSEYKNIGVTIQRYDKNGVITNDIYTLKDTLLTNKEPGEFYSPNQTLYFFNHPGLDKDSKYKLVIDINSGEKKVSAMTSIVDRPYLNGGGFFGSTSPSSGLPFYNGTEYLTLKYKIPTVNNGKSYQLTMKFNYSEYYLNGDFDTTKYFLWNFPVLTAIIATEGKELEQEIDGAEFFTTIQSNIPVVSGEVKYRKYRKIEFMVTVGGEDLNTYLEVNKPATGLIQERPEFTNIDNGIGIFSSRTSVLSEFKKNLSPSSETQLFTGQYTLELGFCGNPGSVKVCQ